MLKQAGDNDLIRLSGIVYIGLSRVYRKLNEYPIARDYAEKSLTYFRADGNWLGMAEAYREVALSYHLEGNSEKALDSFEQGIQIIGDRSAPFMLGRLYTEMSGAYVFLRKPQEGINCLEKSIEFFDRTDHVLNSVIAYNNLGLNLLLIGDWNRAEAMIKRALELASASNHAHVAGILDSLGELKILRGELDEAETLLGQAVAMAEEKKNRWYAVQAMRNLARCRLAQGRSREAAGIARDRILVDPGFGFGKTVAHNLALMNGLALFHGLGCPIVLGASRKRTIGALAGEAPADRRLAGSLALALKAAEQGAQIVRVHDVAETVQALKVWRGLRDEALTPRA
jgi:tetratricopeptide (TPR) repeat protein